MAQMTKEFAETMLERVKAGQHINTTCGEEEQLIRGWLYWHEHYYTPKFNALVAQQVQEIASGIAGAEAISGGPL